MIRRIVHKIKASFNRIVYFFKLLNWARQHTKDIDNYKFLVKLRDTAHDKKLEAQRKEQDDLFKKLEIQEKLINKILRNVKR